MKRQEQLLIILAEECAEVAQRAAKALRFGLDEVQPEQALTNAQRIINEFTDLVAVYQMLDLGSIDGFRLLDKKVKVEKYLEYSRHCGTLDDASVAT